MANLRGGTLDKQVVNLFHRLEAFGTSRDGDHKTHSIALSKKRNGGANRFANHLKEKHPEIDKLNKGLTEKIMTGFMAEELKGLKPSVAIGKARMWSSLVQAMNEEGIKTELKRDFFDGIVALIDAKEEIDNRYVPNAQDLEFARPATQAVKDLIGVSGFRISEAMAVIKDPDKYINGDKIEGVIGKGNHPYAAKSIPHELANKIKALGDDKTTADTIRKDFKAEGFKPHDLRFTYARDTYDAKLEQGVPHKEALLEVSKELNHHRPDITTYYLRRT